MKSLSYLLLVLTAAISPILQAVEYGCTGTVTWLMADHPSCVDSNGNKQFAFKLNSTGNSWICTGSDTAASLILSVKMANKPIRVYFEAPDNSICQTRPHYQTSEYMILMD